MILRVQLFGAPQILREAEPIAFDTRKAAALLAYLAVEGGRHRRESLASLLWPSAEPAKGRATLRRTLSVAAAVGPALRIDGAEVWLDEKQVECDVGLFRAAATDHDSAAWSRAAELASVPFLDGFSLRDSPKFDDWVQATSDALRDELASVLARLAEAGVQRGDLASAAGYAQRRVALDPLSEPAVVDGMRILTWHGDRSGALRLYRSLVRLLDRELGIDPLPATRELAGAIRSDRLAPPHAMPMASGADSTSPVPRVVPLVDRDAERALLDQVCRWTDGLGGGVIGLTGDPGVGRTALLGYAKDCAAAAGVPVLAVTGRAAERHIGYAAAADLISPLITDPLLLAKIPQSAAATLVALGAPGTATTQGEGGTRLLFDAVRQLIAAAARDGNLLIALDDAPYFDDSSQDLLGYLMRRLPERVGAVVTWPTHGAGAQLAVACRDSDRSRVVRIPPLSVASVAGLLKELGAGDGFDPADVARRTGGLPQLVVELVATDRDDGSEVRQLVEARLAAVSPITGQVLATSAVLGVPGDADLLRAVSGRDESEVVDAIEEALQLGLLVDQSGLLDLPHGLARRGVLANTSAVRVRLLHRRAAEHLARRSATNPASVAEHFTAAGAAQEAAQWHRLAAEHAGALGANAECLHHLTQVLAHDPDAVGVHGPIGDALVRMGRYDDALLAYERAGDEEGLGTVTAADVEHRIAGVHARRGDAVLALSHLQTARAALPESADPRLRARFGSEAALLSIRIGDLAQGRSLAEESLALSHSCDDVAEQARARNAMGLVAVRRGEGEKALEELSDSVELARRADDSDVLLAALNSSARCLLAAGRASDSLAAATDALALAQRLGDAHLVGVMHSAVADALHDLGRDQESQQHAASSAAALAEVEGQRDRPGIWLLEQW